MRRIKRRQLVKSLGAIGLGASGALGTRAAHAQDELPKLPEDHPMAIALAYTSDATAEDLDRPARSPGEFCHNCQFFQGQDDQTEGWAECQIFPMFRVSATGWCNTWMEPV